MADERNVAEDGDVDQRMLTFRAMLGEQQQRGDADDEYDDFTERLRAEGADVREPVHEA